MKTLKNIGWYSLTFLSFIMIYSFIQGVGVAAMKLGAPDYVFVPVYVLLAGIFTFVTYKWYKTGTVTIEKNGPQQIHLVTCLGMGPCHCCPILFAK